MGYELPLEFLAFSHKKNLRIFACKNRKILTQKKESELVRIPIPAGAHQIFDFCLINILHKKSKYYNIALTNGELAQLAQSIGFAFRGSGVRVPYSPLS